MTYRTGARLSTPGIMKGKTLMPSARKITGRLASTVVVAGLATVGLAACNAHASTNGAQAGNARPASYLPTSGAQQQASRNGGMHTRVQALLHDTAGRWVGTLQLATLGDGATDVQVRAWGLQPGFHGFHIHQNGVCDPNGAFVSAGGHFNPTGTSEGMQAGAFPVLLVGPDGTAQAEFRDANLKVQQLFGPTGSSVVVHALPDNYANIPPRYTSNGVAGPDMETKMTGDGGDRTACGVIARPTTTSTTTPTPTPTMGGTTTPAPSPTQTITGTHF